MKSSKNVSPTATDQSAVAGLTESNSDFQYMVLYDGHPVSKALFDRVQRQVESNLPTLKRGVDYTAVQLCGRDFWDCEIDDDPRNAGRIIAHLVIKEMVPLIFVKWKHEYPLKYRLE